MYMYVHICVCVSVNVYRHPKDTHAEDGRKIHAQVFHSSITLFLQSRNPCVCITRNIQQCWIRVEVHVA